MNVKRALKVIDDKIEYIRKFTYSARGEDTVRVKLSDLRAVILALSEPEESILLTCGCNPKTQYCDICASNPAYNIYGKIKRESPKQKCEHEWNSYIEESKVPMSDIYYFKCFKCGYDTRMSYKTEFKKDPIKECYEKYKHRYVAGTPMGSMEAAISSIDMWQAICANVDGGK